MVSGSEDRLFQGVDPEDLDMDHHMKKLGNNETDNATQNVEEGGKYWYRNLRGKADATSTRTADKTASSQSRRNLDEEETTSFMIRLHWQPGNCWQGEWIERVWCMTCEAGDECVAGNKLWTQFCDNSAGQKFTWIPALAISRSGGSNYGQLKLAHFDLCLESMTINHYAMQPCDSSSINQVLEGWHPTEPFELHPDEDPQKCVNQHHHPRPEEEIINTSCDLSARIHTNLWQVYQNDNAQNEIVGLRRPQCSEENPCGLCQGDCDSNLECEGDLICVQRGESGFQLPVPGCNGIPNIGADYCTSPQSLLEPQIPNHSLRLREPSCTADNPCLNQCEGTCDGDDSCFGTMKCFIRGINNEDEVPNCVGEEDATPLGDFCYQPDEALSLTTQNHLGEFVTLCTEEKPCFECQGDCDRDSHCYGPLLCFDRSSANPLEPVPGCQGDGAREDDYCYLPEGVSLPTSVPFESPIDDDDDDDFVVPIPPNSDPLPNQQSITLDSPKPLDEDMKTCSEAAPCDECSGDCDGDGACKSGLVCFQRPWNRPYSQVPGCVGRGVAGADYCVKP